LPTRDRLDDELDVVSEVSPNGKWTLTWASKFVAIASRPTVAPVNLMPVEAIDIQTDGARNRASRAGRNGHYQPRTLHAIVSGATVPPNACPAASLHNPALRTVNILLWLATGNCGKRKIDTEKPGSCCILATFGEIFSVTAGLPSCKQGLY
jgi:hypothetical protein